MGEYPREHEGVEAHEGSAEESAYVAFMEASEAEHLLQDEIFEALLKAKERGDLEGTVIQSYEERLRLARQRTSDALQRWRGRLAELP